MSKTKWRDPIVEEMRAAGQKLVERCGGDLHAFCESLRKVEAEYERQGGKVRRPSQPDTVAEDRTPYGS